MKTKLQLDYPAILANTARPVHLALTFDAPEISGARDKPVAFVAVIDRSGSMEGAPLEGAKLAVQTAVRNLRRGDYFGLVAFDNEARTVIPLAADRDRAAAERVISGLSANGSTNLAGGWSLGRDLLSEAPDSCPRKLLLLTDGQLNVGITEPSLVRQLVSDGVEKGRIRTSCLGFGEGYSDYLLRELAKATNGEFHDAAKPESLPEIFRKELDGLQSIVVQNLRVRVRPGGFVENFALLGDYGTALTNDGWHEYAIGDLVSGEQRVVVFELNVLAIPLLEGGQPAATWDGESLTEIEIRCDVITAAGVEMRKERHTVKVRPVQSPEDVQVDTQVLPWVSLQTAARAVERSVVARDAGDVQGARTLLTEELTRLESQPSSPLVEDARNLLRSTLAALADEAEYFLRSRKIALSTKMSFSRGSSYDHTVSESGMTPSFKRARERKASPSTAQAQAQAHAKAQVPTQSPTTPPAEPSAGEGI